jgi:flagellar motor switch protein FliN/FliY
MTEAAPPQPTLNSEVHEYVKVWTETLAQVLTQMAGVPFALESVLASPPETPLPQESDLRAVVAAAGSLHGEMSLRVPSVVVLAVGQLLLQESPDGAASLKPDHLDAVQEFLRQAAGLVATALSPKWGDAQLRVETGTAPPTWSAGERVWLVSTSQTPCRVLLEWQLSSALVASLRPSHDVQDQAAQDQAQNKDDKGSLPAGPTQASAPAPGKLDLLMDVELGVTLRFGKRSMLLREVLELDAGSVVELDRQVLEPADLLLDGRLIARGEVVVVDGNYGLRVLEVVSPPRMTEGLTT